MFSKKNINRISVEETSHSSGSRKILATKEDTTSKYFEAFTYGYLPAGVKWSMHEHDNVVEICVVTKGSGIVKDSNRNIEPFVTGDRFIFNSNTKHEIINNSNEEAEFYFIRFKDQ